MAIEKKNLTNLKIGSIDITHSKEDIFLCLRYLKNSFREMWDTIKCTNICIMRKPELKGRDRNCLWGNNGWKLYKLIKKKKTTIIQKAQQTPNRINTKRSIFQMIKAKTKKITWEKRLITYHNKINTWRLIGNNGGHKAVEKHIQNAERTKLSTQNSISSKDIVQN